MMARMHSDRNQTSSSNPHLEQWNYDSKTGALTPHWINPDKYTFPAFPFTLDRSHQCPAVPAVQIWIQDNNFYVSADSDAFFNSFTFPVTILVSSRFLSRRAVVDSSPRRSYLSRNEGALRLTMDINELLLDLCSISCTTSFCFPLTRFHP
jgi:hypothetical protein